MFTNFNELLDFLNYKNIYSYHNTRNKYCKSFWVCKCLKPKLLNITKENISIFSNYSNNSGK